MSAPRLLTTSGAVRPRGVVLLLHGGAEESHVPASRWGIAALRMLPIALAVARIGRGRVQVLRLVNAERGWNGAEQSPVADTRWALEEIRRRHPGLPVAVVGHSMGGRAALHVADDPAVTVVVGLAPWVTPLERAELVVGQRVVVVHGADDRTTSPSASAALVRAARETARTASWVRVDGQGHALLGRRDAAGRFAARVAVTALGEVPGRARAGSLVDRALAGEDGVLGL